MDEILSYLSWNGTALPGWIYAKATPRNSGRILVRCSDPRGECFGQIPAEVAHRRPDCACGYPFCICQRFLTLLPPEGSEMEINYINLRIKKGFGIKKTAKQVKDEDNEPVEGQFVWGNASPEHRGIYGDPPKPHVPEQGYKRKYFEEQTRILDKESTAEMLYKAAYTQHYSLLQEFPYGLWDTGGAMPQFPFQWTGKIEGDKNPFLWASFRPNALPQRWAGRMPAPSCGSWTI